MKRPVIMILVLAGLAALAFYLAKERGSGTLDRALTDFVVADTSAISRIFIAEQNGGTVDLKRTATGWLVNDTYPARQTNIDLLLKTFRRVEVRSPVPRSAQENVLRVMSSTGKKVEIYIDGALLKTWYVGFSTQDHFGTYMILETPKNGRSSVPYVMGMSGFTGTLASRFHSEIGEWRNSVMMSYPDLGVIRKVEVDHPLEAMNSFQLIYDGEGKFGLSNIQGQASPTADTLAMQDLMLPLKKLNYEYIENEFSKAQRDSVRQSTPARVLRVTNAANKVEELRFFYRKDEDTPLDAVWGGTEILGSDPDRMFSLIEDTTLVVVQRHMFDRVLQPLGNLQ